jgi:plastocyanin
MRKMHLPMVGRTAGKAVKIALILSGLAGTSALTAQTGDVSLRAELIRSGHDKSATPADSSGVVVWLTPLSNSVQPTPTPAKHQGYTLVQKDKQFHPHLLVVPTGSSVDFPNADPFFHNVFSLFDGKRFDLGLYEAHTEKAVRFDREGVSYIFCNIHPQMASVVIALNTPYYGVSLPDGSVVIHDVPAGSYRFSVWAENVPAETTNALDRTVKVEGPTTHLAELHLKTTGDLAHHHANKFGEKYKPQTTDPY